jgi:hypothetical protein
VIIERGFNLLLLNLRNSRDTIRGGQSLNSQ